MGIKLVHIHRVPGSPGGNLYVIRPFNQAAPDQGLPENPNFPDNSLPETPPPVPPPGSYLVLVRAPDGKWKWAMAQEPPVISQPPMVSNPIAPGGPTPPMPTPTGTPPY